MIGRRPAVRLAIHVWLGMALGLAALGLSRPPPAVLAAPQTGGSFTVTSALDSNTNDAVLTLREALLVVRGGTGPAGLNRAASAGEQAALAGCAFGANLITTGCGVGFANSLVFSSSLGLNPVITLTASLPSITNTAPTTLDGSINSVFPIVSAAAIPTHTDALQISSNNNTLAGLTITGAPQDDLHLTGNSNQVLTGTVLLAASRYGLLVDGGQLNTITSILVGTPSAAVGACGQGNQQGGMVLANGALTNTIWFSTVACNTGAGIRLDGSGTTDNQIITSTISAQSGDGVDIVNGANFNHIQGSTITSNSLDGVLISGAATHNNQVLTDFVGVTANGVAAGNGHYGARMATGAHANVIVCRQLLASSACAIYTTISGNGQGGVRLETGATSNDISGAHIGLNPAGTAAVPNSGPGVDVDNAPNTTIGGNLIAVSIGGNVGPGVRYTNTDGGFVSTVTTVGLPGLGNAGPGVELINTTNTAVVADSVRNNAGAGVAVEGAASTGDLVAPFFANQNGGLPIDLGNDGATPNGSHTPPGPDDWLNYPVITSASGSVITGTACLSCTVLIDLAVGNPAAPGGGALQLQTATADATGHWSAILSGGYRSGDITLQACTAPCVHGFGFITPSHSDTSELSPRLQMWLPVVRR